MKEHMLKVDCEVQQDDRGHYADPSSRSHNVEQSKAARVRNEGEADRRGRKDNADQERVHYHYAKIVGPTPAAPDRLPSPGSDHLPEGHQAENAAKRG